MRAFSVIGLTATVGVTLYVTGTAGLVTAAGAAGLRAKVALIEKHFLGGDCLNVGCVPSKCLIRSSRAYADVRDAHEFGVRAAAPSIPGLPQAGYLTNETVFSLFANPATSWLGCYDDKFPTAPYVF